MTVVMDVVFDYVYPAVLIVVLLGVSILVHEVGHFVAARLCGMVVDVFSIGFGPALWKRRHNGVLYKIGCIPIGGYVALPQMEPASAERKKMQTEGKDAEPADEPAADATFNRLPRVSPWKKIVVSVSGAAGNVLLATLLAWLVFWIGKPATPGECSTAVGYVEPDSAAYEAGLRVGYEIVAINGSSVANFTPEIIQILLSFPDDDEVVATVRTPEGTREMVLPVDSMAIGYRWLEGVKEMSLCRVFGVDPDYSAAEAGVKTGDLLKGLDGIDLMSVAHLIDLVKAREDRAVPLELERNDRLMTVTVTPRMPTGGDRAVIGVRFNPTAVSTQSIVHPRPGLSLRGDALVIFRLLRALVTPKRAAGAAKMIGGPLMILTVLWIQIKAGLMIAIAFTSMLNINLAILNLLPIPVLDGGHILFSLWELVTRRPLSERFVTVLVNAFVILLIALMLFLLFRDVRMVRSLFRHGKADAATNAVSPETSAPGATPVGDE